MFFSILIPAYKSVYLKECLDSVLAQSYDNWELIILNDASPNRLEDIISCYNDSRIKYYKNDYNVGAINIVDNWNKCLSYASGDYIICIGDDDKLCPNCLEEYRKMIEAYPGYGLYHGWTEIIDEKSELIDLQASRPHIESAFSLIWHRWDNRNKQYIGDWCFDAKVLKGIGGFHKIDLAWGSDDITAVKAACYNGVINTQKVVFQYRACSQSISRSSNCQIKMKAIQSEREWFEDFLKKPTNNDQDERFRVLALKKMPIRYTKKKIATVAEDLSCGKRIPKLFKWIYKKKVYDLRLVYILYAFIISYKKI